MTEELWTLIGFVSGVAIGSITMQYVFWKFGVPRWGWSDRGFWKSVGLAVIVTLCIGVVYALFMDAITPVVLGGG